MHDIPPNITTIIVAIFGSTLVVNIASWLHEALLKLVGSPKIKNEDIMNSLRQLESATHENKKSIDILKTDLHKVRKKSEENDAKLIRTRILRFNNETVRGMEHTREEWIDCLNAIDEYEKYCEEHEGFKNGYAVESINNLRNTYRKLEREHKL